MPKSIVSVPRRRTFEQYQKEKYKAIFEESPIAIIEQDGRSLMAAYRKFGIEDPNLLYQHLVNRSDVLNDLFSSVKILDANRAAIFLFEAENIEHFFDEFPAAFTKIPNKILANLFIALVYHMNYFESETSILTFQGKKLYVLMRVTVPDPCRANLACMIVTFENITHLKHRELRLSRIAQTDGLTKLFNHRAIDERLKSEFFRAGRHHLPLSCLMIDLDHFKQVNDRFGHPKGDQLLKYVAGILRSSLRKSDIAGRYGGDEFVVILPETRMRQAKATAARLHKRLMEGNPKLKKGDRVIVPTYSIGVSNFPAKKYEHAKDLIVDADKALYKAKGRGGNCIV